MKELTEFANALHIHRPLACDSLEVMNGPEDGLLFPLQPRSHTIGRLQTSDITLEFDTSISRSHARITGDNGHFLIEDLGSTHGTYVNGDKIDTPVPLKDGDEILIGSTLLCFRTAEDQDLGRAAKE